MSRSMVRAGRKHSVVLLGAVLLGVTLGYSVSNGQSVGRTIVRSSLPVALSLGTMALGFRVRRAMTCRQCDRVLLWSLVGGLVTVLVTDWIIFVETEAGQTLLQPLHLLISAVSIGCLVGGLFGVYSVRLRQRTRELAVRTDELVEKNNRLDEFSRIVSHDLRNPLTVAQGHLELAQATGESKHFETVSRSHTRMERLIEEVRSFTRHGVSMQEPEPVRLDEVAEAAWETTATGTADLVVESSRRVVADERRLRTMFENLFRNSVEHNSTSPGSQARQDAVEHGSTNPRSQAHEDAVEHSSTSPGSQARQDALEREEADLTVIVGTTDAGFFVADTGSGILPEERERVFEAGYSRSRDGTGMGLSIVRSIVDSHDWDCRVTTSRADGARFEFTGVEVAERFEWTENAAVTVNGFDGTRSGLGE